MVDKYALKYFPSYHFDEGNQNAYQRLLHKPNIGKLKNVAITILFFAVLPNNLNNQNPFEASNGFEPF